MYKITIIFFLCLLNYGAMSDAEIRVIKLDNGEPNVLEYLEKEKYDSDNEEKDETVYLQLFYECLCPGCIDFDTTEFIDVVKKLHNYLKIDTYPYGNAKTDEQTGEVTCQHGPAECYGNMLHACALDIIHNKTTALIFNSCMMETKNQHSSNDKSADECGKRLKVDSDPIKKCAQSEHGKQLLKYYGEESKKNDFMYVPYVLINKNEFRGNDTLMKSVCADFKKPPPPCL